MKVISSTPHGFLDYAMGVLLIAAPSIFGFQEVTSASMTMTAVGITVLVVSVLTNYPLGLIKAIPFPVHGMIETVGALGLLSSPWLMHYSDVDIARNLALGLGIAYLGVVALTNYTAYQDRRLPH